MSLGPRVRRHWSERRLRRRWLLAATALALSFVPLVGTLGYFSGLVFSPIFSLIAIGVGVDGVRRLRETSPDAAPPSRADLSWRLASDGARELGLLLAIVLGTLLLGMLWNRNCDPGAGLAFFAMGPTASAVIGWTCGIWGGALAHRRRRQLLLGAVPFVFCLVVGLWRLYFDPVVYAYDPFWGWFAGGIYDESVAVGRRYISFRTYNLTGTAAALLAYRVLIGGTDVSLRGVPRLARDRFVLGVAVLLGGAATWTGLHGAERGFTATTESLRGTLTRTHESEHFRIHYAPGSKTAHEIEMVAAEHEFAWHRLADALGREPRHPVDSFVFSNPDQKRNLFGAGQVEVSLPWKGHIYLHHMPFPHSVLHHELAHTFGGAFGDRLLGISARPTRINMGLVEGLANALAPRSSFGLDLHDQAAVLERLDRRPPLEEIMGVGFWRRASRPAYTAAGSFVLWLLENHGVEPVIAVYANAGDFEAAFGIPLAELEAQWLMFVRARTLEDEDVEAMRERFKQRSIFRRPCAHRVAALRKQAGAAKARGQAEDLLRHQETLCTIEPDRAEHRIALATAHAELGDYASAQAELGRAEEMEQMTHQLLAVIHERRGDVALLAGDGPEASVAFGKAMTYGLAEGPQRVLQVKKRAADDPAAMPEILDYFQPFATDQGAAALRRMYAAVRLSERPGWRHLGRYLLARQLLNASQPGLAIPPLQEALEEEGGEAGLGSPELVRAARFALVNALVQEHRWEEAERVLDRLSNDPAIKSGHQLTIGLWRDRVRYFSGYFAD